MCCRVLFVLVIVFITGAVRSHPAKTCPDGWTKFKSSCYGVGTEKVTWADAQEICRLYGGHLAEIETTAENEFVKELGRSRGYISVFLGALDTFVDGHWVWASDRRPLTFDDWYPGQKTANEGASEDCLFLHFHNNKYSWHDVTCSTILLFICETRSDETGPWEAVTTQELSALRAELEAAKNNMAAMQAEFRSKTAALQAAQGSTFIRWGRSACPDGTQTVYSGFGAGSGNAITGSGANRLCLSPNPVFDQTRYDVRSNTGSLYGAQYYVNGHHNTDVLCALCHTTYSTTFMVPGTNKCPASSTLQYYGYLSTDQDNMQAQSEFVCLDAAPEDRVGSDVDYGTSGWFEYTVTVCGSLPCPPYVPDKILMCAVCSQ